MQLCNASTYSKLLKTRRQTSHFMAKFGYKVSLRTLTKLIYLVLRRTELYLHCPKMFADCRTLDLSRNALHALAQRIHTLPWISDIRADATPVHNELDFRL